ncbi:hypothetical protein E2C01_002743 [Portunus trituberculatus]|uniref:Uncharacterized protein n=1 Tax=Portunus trituberculatus TaxID=210409 RepID=A0A5B7CNB6_PORTR|nr:hypothetical protein [Portunus trituberculatus]
MSRHLGHLVHHAVTPVLPTGWLPANSSYLSVLEPTSSTCWTGRNEWVASQVTKKSLSSIMKTCGTAKTHKTFKEVAQNVLLQQVMTLSIDSLVTHNQPHCTLCHLLTTPYTINRSHTKESLIKIIFIASFTNGSVPTPEELANHSATILSAAP